MVEAAARNDGHTGLSDEPVGEGEVVTLETCASEVSHDVVRTLWRVG